MSSSHNRVSVGVILAASAWVFGEIATRNSAAGNSGGGDRERMGLCHTGCRPSPSPLSFATQPRSPA